MSKQGVDGATGYVINGTYMTSGQEWYYRFTKEIDKLGFKYNVKSINRNMVEAAAKRASGVSE